VFKFSQVSLTKPQSGSRFKVNKVHFLSLKSDLAFGGSQSQNSSTLTQNFLAAEKCPSSWIRTTIEKIIIAVSIQRKSISLGIKGKDAINSYLYLKIT
jgi:hypothetical protein